MKRNRTILCIVFLVCISVLLVSCGDNSTIDIGNLVCFGFDAEKTAVAFRYGPVIDTEGNYMKIKEDLKIADLFLVFEKIPGVHYRNMKNNVIDSGLSKKKYSVGVFFRFEGEENARMYDFTFIGRVRDNYTLLIKLRNEDLCLDTELKFTIHFYKDNNGNIYGQVNWDPIENDYYGGLYLMKTDNHIIS